MNRKEMAQVLFIMQEYFGSTNITDNTINAWLPLFEEYSYQEVVLAVKLLGKEREYTSFPAPASIIKYIDMINNQNNESELWNVAHRAIGQASTFTRETFEQLPYQVREFFGNPTALKEYGLKDMSEIGAVRNAFMRALPSLNSRRFAKKEVERLLSASAQLGGDTTKKLTEFLGKEN